jgi:hypothetical protein
VFTFPIIGQFDRRGIVQRSQIELDTTSIVRVARMYERGIRHLPDCFDVV